MKIKYSNNFRDDISIHENTIVLTGYGFSFASLDLDDLAEGNIGDVWRKTSGVGVLKDSDTLKIYLDFNGINIISSIDNPGTPIPGEIDILESTLETKYTAIFFFYTISDEEKLAFTLLGDSYITDLCVNRNIIEISLPTDSTNIIGSLEDPDTDFLEGPGKEVGVSMYESSSADSMVSRKGYYKYIRVENSKESANSDLSWESSGSRHENTITKRIYQNLEIDFGNFTEDPRSNTMIRSGLPTSLPSEESSKEYSFDLHGTVEYIDLDIEGNEISRGKLPIEEIEEFEIECIDSSVDFNYTIDNLHKSVHWIIRRGAFYIFPYGLFRAHIPSFLPTQEDLYSKQFKIVLEMSEATWTFDPQTEDKEPDDISVITLDGALGSSRAVYFTTTIPLEYLSESNCLVDFEDLTLDEYFDYTIGFSRNSEDPGLTDITIEFITLQENDEASWVPQNESGNPYLVTFSCTIDNYSQSMYLAQYQKTPPLFIIDKDNNIVTTNTITIPSNSLYADFSIAIRNNDNYVTWNASISAATTSTLKIVDSTIYPRTITSGGIYNITGEQIAPPSNKKYCINSNADGDIIPGDLDLGYIDFISNPVNGEEVEDDTIPEWRTRVGSCRIRMNVIKESAGPYFTCLEPESGKEIGSISLIKTGGNSSYRQYNIYIYTNREFTATLTFGSGDTGGISFSSEGQVNQITLNEANSDLILYNKSVEPWQNYHENKRAGMLKLKSNATDLPAGTVDEYNIPILRSSPDNSNKYTFNGGNYPDWLDKFPISYASKYSEDPNAAPRLNRFGVIDNVLEHPLPGESDTVERSTQVYFASSTNIVSISAITSLENGFSSGYSAGSTEFNERNYSEYFDIGLHTNQVATITVSIDKTIISNSSSIDKYYFPTSCIGYIKYENWNPNGQPPMSNIIGCLFMKPFDNSFWYEIDNSGEIKSSSIVASLLFEETAGDSHTLTIYSRYEINSSNTAVYLDDDFGNSSNKDFYYQGGGSVHISAQRASSSSITPTSANHYCRYSTTYTFTTSDPNSGVYRVFNPFTISPEVTNDSTLSKFVDDTNLNTAYSQEVGYNGERYNSTIARRTWGPYDSGSPGGLMTSEIPTLTVTLVQKGESMGGVEITSSPSISGTFYPPTRYSNGYFVLYPSGDVTITNVSSSGTRIDIGSLANNNTISFTVWGVIQENSSLNVDALWSSLSSAHPNVFDYSNSYSRSISASLTVSYKSKYDESLVDTETRTFSATQPGYPTALYFYSSQDSYERFGIGYYWTGAGEVLDTSNDIDIPEEGGTLDFLIGNIAISSSGPSTTEIGSIRVYSFTCSESELSGSYTYNSSAPVSRGSGTNLSLTFPQNLTGHAVYYELSFYDSISTLKIKFKQEPFVGTIKFYNSTGTTELTGGLEILSDGTIYKGAGIGNVGGSDYGILYFKTNINPQDISFSFTGVQLYEGQQPEIQIAHDNLYVARFRFNPNRSLRNSSGDIENITGTMTVLGGSTTLASISVTQYSFSIELQYYTQENTGGTFALQPRGSDVSNGTITLYDTGVTYTISNNAGHRSCFKINRFKVTDPIGNCDYSHSQISGVVIDPDNLRVQYPQLSPVLNDASIQVLLSDTSYFDPGVSPYLWFTYSVDTEPGNEINGISISFSLEIKHPGGGDNNFLYLSNQYQTFNYMYSAKKLITGS